MEHNGFVNHGRKCVIDSRIWWRLCFKRVPFMCSSHGFVLENNIKCFQPSFAFIHKNSSPSFHYFI